MASFENRRFAYRPVLSNERRDVVSMLRVFKSEDYVRHVIRKHLVWESSPFELWSDIEQDYLFYVIMGKQKPRYGHVPTQADVQNLYDGVILELTKPQFAKRDCNVCKRLWLDDDTGKPVMKGGKPLLRPVDSVLLCQTKAGCPKGTPENPKSLSPKNRLAWNHFRDCAAVGQFPDDPIVRRNARVIRAAMAVAAKRKAAA